jgi:hypothetical protein
LKTWTTKQPSLLRCMIYIFGLFTLAFLCAWRS